jgi:hypothetical protein
MAFLMLDHLLDWHRSARDDYGVMDQNCRGYSIRAGARGGLRECSAEGGVADYHGLKTPT